MSDKIIHASPDAVTMIARMLGLDKPEAETALAKIAQAVVDKSETEADNGT